MIDMRGDLKGQRYRSPGCLQSALSSEREGLKHQTWAEIYDLHGLVG